MTKKELAQNLGVSVSSLYYKPKRDSIDLEIKAQIESVMIDHPTYGHKRIAIALKLNKKRILRVMKKYGLKPYRRRLSKLYLHQISGQVYISGNGDGSVYKRDYWN